MPKKWLIRYWVVTFLCFVIGFLALMGGGLEWQMSQSDEAPAMAAASMIFGGILMFPAMLVWMAFAGMGLNTGLPEALGFLLGIVAHFVVYYALFRFVWSLRNGPSGGTGSGGVI